MNTVSKQYYIGTSGWNYKHWQEAFYPQEISKAEWFDFYTEYFDTVEINYSFYKWPNKNTLRKWRERAPKNFYFTLKSPRTITHAKKFKDAGKPVSDFYALTGILGDRMACHLFQAPPSFKYTENNFEKLEQFFKSLHKRKQNVIEFRDPSWWRNETYDLLRKYNIIFCVVSGLGMPDTVIATNKDIAYFRFHGVEYGGNYSNETLLRYADIFRKLEAKKIYAYFNNDIGGYAPKNASELLKMIKQ
ncbi:hypothetical protein A2Y83_01895 [Candidatus Falkowbacteria bacterium RBG_13_39_14]|uniref:Histidine kinase n=1 Tax=Candidatus Falkowbacteria bacterium RBG_13_39_14 TaxID=1797985 RepID=A0A1F5S153_9BACT|nr:MAG: hypothetical protein A2Y83_01895 [Candidatus Falkowbacteria bacterium RBG_13_39_14]